MKNKSSINKKGKSITIGFVDDNDKVIRSLKRNVVGSSLSPSEKKRREIKQREMNNVRSLGMTEGQRLIQIISFNYSAEKRPLELQKAIVNVRKFCAKSKSSYDYLDYNYWESFLNTIEQYSLPITIKDRNYTNDRWFFIGLKFANGEMDNLLKKHNYSCAQVAKELCIEGDRPYISDTVRNKGDKNIYGSIDKMEKIQAYCTENNIETNPHFTAALKRLQSR